MIKLSAVILTRNEEENIKECIKSVNFCDEIVVVDDRSSDKSALIAKKLGAKVFVREMKMDFSAQSNFGMEKTEGEWVFFLDADERVNKDLKNEILEKIAKASEVDGYFLRRQDYMWNHLFKYGEGGSLKVMRLVRRSSGKWNRRVHPNFQLKGKIENLKNPIIHYSHETLSEFLISVNRWSSWHAMANKEEAKVSSIFKILLWPCLHFTKNFILRRGYLDGLPGFVFAIVMSFHSFLAWSKLWTMQSNLKES